MLKKSYLLFIMIAFLLANNKSLAIGLTIVNNSRTDTLMPYYSMFTGREGFALNTAQSVDEIKAWNDTSVYDESLLNGKKDSGNYAGKITNEIGSKAMKIEPSSVDWNKNTFWVTLIGSIITLTTLFVMIIIHRKQSAVVK